MISRWRALKNSLQHDDQWLIYITIAIVTTMVTAAILYTFGVF